MKASKLAAGLFAIVGTVLLAGSFVLCLSSLNRPAKVLDDADAAACSQTMLEAMNAGDFSQVQTLLYGQPELGVDGEPESALGKQLWQAYRTRISMEYQGGCYVTESGLSRDASVTTLNLTDILEKVNERASALLQKTLDESEEPEALLEETGEVPQSLKDALLQQALNEVLEQNPPVVTWNISVDLVCRDGQWWVIPDPVLLRMLSGGLD